MSTLNGNGAVPDEDEYEDIAGPQAADQVVPGQGHSNDDMPTRAPDYEPRLRELVPGEFPVYFHERNGALFHSHGVSPYPLPVHGPEWNRLNVQHSILHLLQPQYMAVVRQALAPDPQIEGKLAIDLCTGTGKWVMEMARDFPHVWFRGIDIVPIATRYPLENVQFELQDVSTDFRWRDGCVDLVHARDMALAIRDYAPVVEEAARILRRGGCFVSIEWGLHPAFSQEVTAGHAPAMTYFFDLVRQNLASRGIQAYGATTVANLIRQNGRYTEPVSETIEVPIGSWPVDLERQRLGKAFRAVQRYFAGAIKPFLAETVEEGALNAIIQNHINEMMVIPGLVTHYYATYARRL